MQENNNLLNEVITELRDVARNQKEILSLLDSERNPVSEDWIPRNKLMVFLGYENTQMGKTEKREKLTVSKIGKQKFYHRTSIDQMLQRSIVS